MTPSLWTAFWGIVIVAAVVSVAVAIGLMVLYRYRHRRDAAAQADFLKAVIYSHSAASTEQGYPLITYQHPKAKSVGK